MAQAERFSSALPHRTTNQLRFSRRPGDSLSLSALTALSSVHGEVLGEPLNAGIRLPLPASANASAYPPAEGSPKSTWSGIRVDTRIAWCRTRARTWEGRRGRLVSMVVWGATAALNIEGRLLGDTTSFASPGAPRRRRGNEEREDSAAGRPPREGWIWMEAVSLQNRCNSGGSASRSRLRAPSPGGGRDKTGSHSRVSAWNANTSAPAAGAAGAAAGTGGLERPRRRRCCRFNNPLVLGGGRSRAADPTPCSLAAATSQAGA